MARPTDSSCDEESLFLTPEPDLRSYVSPPDAEDQVMDDGVFDHSHHTDMNDDTELSPVIKQEEEVSAANVDENDDEVDIEEALADCRDHGRELEAEIRQLKQDNARLMDENAGLNENNVYLDGQLKKAKGEKERMDRDLAQRGEEIMVQRGRNRVLKVQLEEAQVILDRHAEAEARQAKADVEAEDMEE